MTDQEVKLTVAQGIRLATVQRVCAGGMTNAEAAACLSLSVRQVRRLKRRVERLGPPGVFHGNTGRSPANTKPAEVRERVVALATGPYAALNFSHLADWLAEQHGIVLSDETLRRWLRPLGHGAAPRRAKAHRRRRTRSARAGEMLFLDGSPHPWFGPDHPDCCLLLASDDATGDPLRGLFVPAESRDGCFEVCHHVFARLGLPAAFYLDKASQFTTTRHGGLHVRQSPLAEPTHFERAMDTLGVRLLFAHSPQARGRGERLNGSFQYRLVAELALHGIADLAAATRYLNRVFIPRYARRFRKPPADPTPAWRPLPPGLDLKAILAAHHPRTVANDNTVQLHGSVYQLQPPRGLLHLARAKLQVQERFDGSVHFLHPQHGYLRATRLPSPRPTPPPHPPPPACTPDLSLLPSSIPESRTTTPVAIRASAQGRPLRGRPTPPPSSFRGPVAQTVSSPLRGTHKGGHSPCGVGRT